MEYEPIQEAEDGVKLDFKTIMLVVIIFAVGMIIAGAYLIISEIYGAKNSCEEKGMEYKFEFPYQHLCNSKPFFKYNNGWDFSREVNISIINFSKMVYP